MKLFVIAAFIAVAAGARLEHLERSYLPPFGSNGGIGAHGSQGSFGVNPSAFGAAGTGLSSRNSFADATSNQYLPPDQGSFASNSAPQIAGSIQGFGGQNFPGQQYNGQQATPTVSTKQYGLPQASNSFGAPSFQAQFPQQPTAASRQYLAPSTNNFQNTPQQSFDELTGYHY